MYSYSLSFKYSKDGRKNWTSTTTTVKAESDLAAIEQVKSKYLYVKDIRVLSRR